eukprot:gene51-54_t
MSSLSSPLPFIPSYGLDREFSIEQVNEEVTSIDIAPNGGFCIVACSNGAVLLFDMTNLINQKNGYLIGHIRPKGMHTSLKLTIKISEDSRFCFVGVRKGSSDMVAIDLGCFVTQWEKFPALNMLSRARKQAQTSASYLLLPPFDTYTHNDPKLRGFGTATTVPIPKDSNTYVNGTLRFWLACGMGIKNVHVWQLTISPLDANATPSSDRRDQWICIFDVPTNGSSISHLTFRQEGRELLSKCDRMNLRLWDLSQFDIDPTLKPPYEDIPNSADVKCMMELTPFTFGGAYEFAVVKADRVTPKEANRNVFDLPDKLANANSAMSLDDEGSVSNLRRRRATREIEEVLATSDGQHGIILCADGFAMYFSRQKLDKVKQQQEEGGIEEDGYDNGQLQEVLGSLQDMDNRDQCWALRKVGAQGHVLLLRVLRPSGSTSLKASAAKPSLVTVSISRLDRLLDPSSRAPSPIPTTLSRDVEAAVVVNVPKLPPRPVMEKKRKAPIENLSSSSSITSSPSSHHENGKNEIYGTPSTRISASSPSSSRKAPRCSPLEKVILSAASSPAVTKLDLTRENSERTSFSTGIAISSPFASRREMIAEEAKATTTTTATTTTEKKGKEVEVEEDEMEEVEESPSGSLYPPLVINRPHHSPVKISDAVIRLPPRQWTSEASILKNRMEDLFSAWSTTTRQSSAELFEEIVKSSELSSLPTFTQEQLKRNVTEALRVEGSLYNDLQHILHRNLSFDTLNNLEIYRANGKSPTSGLKEVSDRYRRVVFYELMPKFKADLSAAIARDAIQSSVSPSFDNGVDWPRRCLLHIESNLEDVVDGLDRVLMKMSSEAHDMLQAMVFQHLNIDEDMLLEKESAASPIQPVGL